MRRREDYTAAHITNVIHIALRICIVYGWLAYTYLLLVNRGKYICEHERRTIHLPRNDDVMIILSAALLS